MKYSGEKTRDCLAVDFCGKSIHPDRHQKWGRLRSRRIKIDAHHIDVRELALPPPDKEPHSLAEFAHGGIGSAPRDRATGQLALDGDGSPQFKQVDRVKNLQVLHFPVRIMNSIPADGSREAVFP